MRSVVHALVLVCAAACLVSCEGCSSPYSRLPDPEPDAEAGEPDGGTPFEPPGVRPVLEDPAQLVPLLYGRVVELEHTVADEARTRAVPLDDPQDPAYRAFFGDLEALCSSATRQQLDPPTPDAVRPAGCARDGAFTGMMFACRANAALAFAAEGSQAGLSRDKRGELWLDLGKKSEARVWTAAVDSADVRASFAMLAVFQLREAVRALAFTFDTERCKGFDPDEGFTTRPLADQAAEALFKSEAVLEQATRASDMWLTRALVARVSDVEDGRELRIALTRGLNGSLLERQKLFNAVPYGAFAPLDGEPDAEIDAPGRYPALYEVSSEGAAIAVHVMSTLRVSPFGSDGAVADEDTLALRLFSGLRRESPLVFGAWDVARVDAALAALNLDRQLLAAGARQLVQTLRATGTPWLAVDSVDGLSSDGLLAARWHEPGPAGFAFALLEGAAPQAEDAYELASRGLAHARQLARTAAQRALQGAELGVRARGFLTPLAEAVGPSASLCRTASDEGTTAQLSVTGLAALKEGDALSSFELWLGEAALACALQGHVADAPCDEQEGVVPARFDSQRGRLRFEILTGKGDVAAHRVYLTRRALDDDAREGRAVVAAFSLEPFQDIARESCGLLPLDAQLMEDMRSVHSASVGTLLRAAVLPRAETSFELGLSDAVPLTYQRTIRVSEQGGPPQLLHVAQPFRASVRDFMTAVQARCDAAPALPWRGPLECNGLGAALALREACVAGELSSLADTDQTTSLGSLSLVSPSEQERVTLRLLAFERAELALVHVLDLMDPSSCMGPAVLPAETEERVSVAWPAAAALIAQLTRDEPILRAGLSGERAARWGQEPAGALKEAGTVRDALHSALAEARLYVASPLGIYGSGDTSLTDAIADALTRFPAVTRPAASAEDERIESFLRASGLHPLAPDLALEQGSFVPASVADVARTGANVRWLRLQLVDMDAKYASYPAEPAAFLSALGISQAQYEAGLLRIIEQSEASGLSLLSVPGTAPTQVFGLSASHVEAHSAHLFALSAGRLPAHPTATRHHGRVAGLFHLLAHARSVLTSADLRAPAPDETERAARAALMTQLAPRSEADGFAIETTQGTPEPQLAIEFALSDGLQTGDLATYAELWWTESGMRCALSGLVAGEPCDERNYRFGTSSLSVVTLRPKASGMPERIRLTGFAFPAPVSWNPSMTDALRRGRVYMTVRNQNARRVVASLSLEGALSLAARVEAPDSAPLQDALTTLLAYRPPAESCAACAPSSVCETTRCEQGSCVREPVADGLACTLAGQCVAGVCNAPGCGDGTRSTGSSGVAFEGCDDGNLLSLDGCSVTCEPEVRRIAPAPADGWPAGPAPAVGIDGLGQTLVVYTTDSPSNGAGNAIHAAAFDAFGAPVGEGQSLEAQVPRDSSAPNVVGLPDGGFVVAYGSISTTGTQSVAFRVVDQTYQIGSTKLVEVSTSEQTQVRLAATDEGFVAVWRQDRAATGTRLRMRRFDARGEAIAPSVLVAEAPADVAQSEPNLASSRGQWLVTWSQESAGAELGVYGRRFGPDAKPVDEAAFVIAAGAYNEPSVATLSSGDYVIAFTDRGADSAGDIATRVVRRFGAPLHDSSLESAVATPAAETTPVISAARGAAFVVGYQLGAPQSVTKLFAPSVDPVSVELVQTHLDQTGLGDLSMVSGRDNAWLVWSEATPPDRAPFVYRLPLERRP